nr:hypothetical protein [uncultured Devosia sp.]
MPLFFFDVLEVDGSVTTDTTGVDLSSPEAAKHQADLALAEITAAEIIKSEDFTIRLRVRDQSGAEINCRHVTVSQTSFGM